MTQDTRATLLLPAAQRAVRTPKGRLAMALHLSRLPAPGPRHYHRRIALAVLKETAAYHDGEVFLLPDGDAVLLCSQQRVAAAGAEVADPARLPWVLARLFQADLPAGIDLTTVWALERDSEGLLGYAAGRAA